MCFSWSCQKMVNQRQDVEAAYTVDGVIGSFIHVFGMMQGEFSTQMFEKPWRNELKKGGFTLSGSFLYFLFCTFMLLVPIVMVNVLIASMQRSYDAVFARREGYMLRERAKLILELESLVKIEVQSTVKPVDHSWVGGFVRAMQVLFTSKIAGDEQTAGTYLHVLSSVESGVHQKPETKATSEGEGTSNSSASNAELDRLKQRNETLMSQNRDLATQMADLMSGYEPGSPKTDGSPSPRPTDRGTAMRSASFKRETQVMDTVVEVCSDDLLRLLVLPIQFVPEKHVSACEYRMTVMNMSH